jgi:outer membrane protein TolC
MMFKRLTALNVSTVATVATATIVATATTAANAAPTPLYIQDVIEMVLTKGLNQKDIDFGFQKAEISLLLSEATFDTQMYIKGQNEDSRAETLGAVANDRDQTQTFGVGLSRKLKTGSTLGLDYSYIHRESDLSSYAQSSGVFKPIQYYHLTTLSFKQDLLNNTFGFRDRRLTDAARLQFDRAQFERDEASEDLVLLAIKIYLDAYYAQENLKQSLAARDKYLLLLKSVQQKARMGFDDRSELTKTKAELQNQERNVKSASLTYLNLLEKLYAMLNATPPDEVTIAVPETIPSPSSVSPSPSIENLRKSKSTELLVKATDAEREAAQNNQLAALNFFGQAAFSGLDKSNSAALSEMNHRENPKYTVGLELVMRWGGSTQKAETLSKRVAHEEALNAQQKVQNDLNETLERTQRNLQSKYIVAVNAQETVKIWDEALQSQERNHRFGRITTAELITDYGSFFRAKSSLSGALADYQLALYEYQAARDELIKSQK